MGAINQQHLQRLQDVEHRQQHLRLDWHRLHDRLESMRRHEVVREAIAIGFVLALVLLISTLVGG